MKFKIGVYGSAEEMADHQIEKARALGRELAKYKDQIIIITGACSGIPYEVAHEAASGGVEVWGYSPATDLESQKKLFPKDDSRIYKKLFYIEKTNPFKDIQVVARKYRNVASTANCDGAIIISGRWGTLNEFTDLIDYGKVIGVFTGTGGVADLLENLMGKIKKQGSGKVIFQSSADLLVKDIVTSLKNPT